MKPFFATSIADSQGDITDKLRNLLPQLLDRFQGISALVTTDTDSRILKILQDANAFLDQAESSIDAIGLHRRRSIELVLENSKNGHIFRSDLDHLLRWIEENPRELDLTLEKIEESDFTVIGRSSNSFDALPQRLKETEKVINHIFFLITRQNWDVLMGTSGLSRTAAELITKKGITNTAGNDVEWPLLCKKHGLLLNYVEAEGLTYKTEFDYANNLNDSLDQMPEAWAFRVKLAYQQVVAMQPYMDN